jgi:formate dehydrogenase (NADP+) beta subunit
MANTDITKPVDLSIHAEGTGPKRSRRPEYVDFMPPCNSACPAGENIQAWLNHAQAGNYYEAFQTILEDNPFPAIMGRVCVKSCETGCNRNHIDTTVSIHAVERHIGEKAIEEKWTPRFETNPTNKRILVVGGGPGGLSAAYHLARQGHTVEVFEAGSELGGLMRTGIPEYRLPKRVLDAEISRLSAMGITFRLNYKVTDIVKEKQDGKFDAVYLSIGAQMIRKEPIAEENAVPVTDAFTFFKDAETANIRGKKVIVYGGGKLAMYLSRIIKRLGAEAIVLFPGDRKLMPAYDYEADDALAEGVDIQFLNRIHKISMHQFTLEKMKVEKGKAIGTSEYSTLEGDMLVLALSQESESGFLRTLPNIVINDDGTVVIGADRMTKQDGIFAGGDMLPGEQRSATIAIGHGKKAAKYINAYVTGSPYQKPDKHPTAGYRKLHMWYQTEAPQKEQNKLAPEVAVMSFDEVIAGLDEKAARYEAQRCLSCGNCFECDGCFGACPENAIIKLGPGKGYRFDFNLCTGCAVCYEQCPCHAIEMISEPSKAINDAN